MPVFVKRNASVLFIHIPKCGGSSFERLSANAGWKELFSVRGVHASRLKGFKCSPQHFHGELLEQTCDIDRFDAVLALVRHPYFRLKSEFYWQRAQGMSQLAPRAWWENTQNQHRDNPYVFDNHIRPQSDFLVGAERLEIFKLEENGPQNALESLQRHAPGKGVRSYFDIGRRRSKKSPYDSAIEDAFAEIRSDIEDFYSIDMTRLEYS